jgi:hypothetical protein
MKSLGKKGAIDLIKLLVVLLILGFCGLLPFWGYSHSWGYYPGGFVGLILLLVVLRVLGVL